MLSIALKNGNKATCISLQLARHSDSMERSYTRRPPTSHPRPNVIEAATNPSDTCRPLDVSSDAPVVGAMPLPTMHKPRICMRLPRGYVDTIMNVKSGKSRTRDGLARSLQTLSPAGGMALLSIRQTAIEFYQVCILYCIGTLLREERAFLFSTNIRLVAFDSTFHCHEVITCVHRCRFKSLIVIRQGKISGRPWYFLCGLKRIQYDTNIINEFRSKSIL
jgi:hypothetical protein